MNGTMLSTEHATATSVLTMVQILALDHSSHTMSMNTYLASALCGWAAIAELGRRVPLNKCMKLEMIESVWTAYTCYNGSLFVETFDSMNCWESGKLTQNLINGSVDYQCGLGGNCEYSSFYVFDRCDGNYFESEYDFSSSNVKRIGPKGSQRLPIENYTFINTITGEFGNYYANCNFFNTPSPTTTNCQSEIYDDCMDIPVVTDVSCGFVHVRADLQYSWSTMYALNECQSDWKNADYSFEFYCDDGKIHQNVYDEYNCVGPMKTRKLSDYTWASCSDETYCDTAKVIINECSNFTDYWTGHDTQFVNSFNATFAVDICVQTDSFTSEMTKCTDNSIVFYKYFGFGCSDEASAIRMEFSAQCGLYTADILECTTPKCPLIYPYEDSHALCNIFSATDVSSSVDWWNEDYENYCNWYRNNGFRRRMYDYYDYYEGDYYDIYQNHFAPNGEFECDDGEHISILDLSNTNVSGSIDTVNYDWPSQMRGLNLANLGLRGVWNWKALENTSNYLDNGLDISGNNFSGTLDLQYVIGTDKSPAPAQ